MNYRAILRECGIDPLALDAREFIAIINAMSKVHTAAHNQGYMYAISEWKD